MSTDVIETVQRATPLAVAFYDPLTDAAITDGLAVIARPSAHTGSFRRAVTTPGGVHVVSGIRAMHDIEFSRVGPGERAEPFDDDLPSASTVDIDVVVEDRFRRFLTTVMRLAAPRRGVVTAADALEGCAALVMSVPDDTPMFLMSSPHRSIPASTAVVRACLRRHSDLEPAAPAVLTVECAGIVTVGVADEHGNVAVPFAYPSFDGSALPSPPAGAHGTPTTDQQWPVEIGVRWEPDQLDVATPAGIDVPRVHAVFCQRSGTVFADDVGPDAPSLASTLEYGVPLVLQTTGPTDPTRASYLLIEPAT